ncbi:MAG TPA: S-layer protein, partial [Actinomycetota bacterium]
TRLISKTSAGAPADDDSDDPAISANGRFVAFESNATNLPAGALHADDMVYVHDRKTRKTRLVSKSSTGAPADADADDASISPEGRFVAFESSADNLPGGAVATDDLAYVHDRKSGKTVLVSKAANGAPANDFAGIPSASRALSSRGAFVVFTTQATNLPGWDVGSNELVYIRGALRWPR